MHLSNQSLLVIILVGIVAGYLAGRVMEGGGFGLIGDLLVGLIGAFIGDWLLPRLGIHLGVGIVAFIVNAFIGAVVLLLILRLLNGGFGNRRGWSGGEGNSGRSDLDPLLADGLIGLQFVRRAFEDDAAVAHDVDAVRDS